MLRTASGAALAAAADEPRWKITDDEALVRCYLHTSQHAPQGWYEKAERRLELAKSFRREA